MAKFSIGDKVRSEVYPQGITVENVDEESNTFACKECMASGIGNTPPLLHDMEKFELVSNHVKVETIPDLVARKVLITFSDGVSVTVEIAKNV